MPSPLPIIYLHTSNGGGIRGAIRFQKLVFLGQMESDLPENYRFIPYKFGPYSYQLQRDIEDWISSEYILRNETRNHAGNFRVDYSLTPDGVRLAKSLLNSGYNRLFEEASTITSEYGGKDLSELLKYVYNKYPDYTDESTLDIERLFSDTTVSQFTESDSTNVGPFDQIKKIGEQEGEVAGLSREFIRQDLEIGSRFQATIERITDDSLSVYWSSPSPTFDSFVRAVDDDSNVGEDSAVEMRVRDSHEWICGDWGEIMNETDPDSCQFLRVETKEDQYTVSWEASGRERSEEITIQVMEKNIDYRRVREALVHYATATALNDGVSQLSPLDTTDDRLTESLRQTAKLAVS